MQVPPALKVPVPLLAKLTVPVGVTAVPVSLSVTVAVQLVATFTSTGFGAQETAVDVLRLLTVTLAEAVLPVPPLPDVTAVVVLFFTPNVVPVTFTEKLQAPGARLFAEKLIVPLPAVAVALAAQAPVSPFGVETTRPEGSVSENATVVRLVPEFGLLTVKLRLVDPFSGILAAPKDLLMLGGARMVTAYAALSEHWLPPPKVHVGEVIVDESEMFPVAGPAGAWKVNDSNSGVPPVRFVKLPEVEPDVRVSPEKVSDQLPLSLVLASPPLLLLVIAN